MFAIKYFNETTLTYVVGKNRYESPFDAQDRADLMNERRANAQAIIVDVEDT
jgi:hypothetical protein